jgi:hypothetical protein
MTVESEVADAVLKGGRHNGIISGMFGALSPITGNYYLGAGTGALNGYLNYRNTKKVTNEKKNYDPDRLVSMQSGGAVQVTDFEVEGAIAGIEVNDNSPLGNEIRNLISTDINSLNYATTKTSRNRMRFDYTTAAVVARKIDTLRRIEQALVTLRHEKNSARGVVHSQMSEGAESYESSDTAQKIVSQKYDLYTQAYQMKSSSIQERIQAHNQRITDQMNIDRARFGIYTSAASGALGGIAGGMYAGTRQSDFMARAFMRSGDAVISGRADELYEVNMPDSDYNLTDNKFGRPTYQQFVDHEQLVNGLKIFMI